LKRRRPSCGWMPPRSTSSCTARSTLMPSLKVIAKGLPASPGAASGKIVFDADKAEEMAQNNEKVLLVRTETTPDDIHGIVAAQGVLTTRGGMTSHAAVVARGMGKPCVCGCEAVEIDAALGTMEVEGW
jgi:pyruvate, orthophosphate dikinase